MPELAVFTVGANKQQIEKMIDYAKDKWDFAGEYNSTEKLVNNARLKRLDHVLVIDFDVEVISFIEQKKLEERLEEEKSKRRKETEVRIEEDGEYAVIEEMK